MNRKQIDQLRATIPGQTEGKSRDAAYAADRFLSAFVRHFGEGAAQRGEASYLLACDDFEAAKARLAGLRPEDFAENAAQAADDAAPKPQASDTPPTAEAPATEPRTRAGTKQATLIEMLRRPSGANVEEIAAATGWQRHTIRGAIAGGLRKKLGLAVTSEKVEGRGTVYRIAA